jgi:hypothetical protein
LPDHRKGDKVKSGMARKLIKEAIDGSVTRRYIANTSLLFVSTAGRGAASSEAALAFSAGQIPSPEPVA